MDPAARTDQLPRWLKASVRDGDVDARRRRGQHQHVPRREGPRVADRPPRRGGGRLRADQPGRARPRRSRRSAVCSTSRSPAPSGCCGSAGRSHARSASARSSGGRRRSSAASRRRSATSTSGAARPVAAADHLATSRAALAASGAEVLPGADPAVLAALRAWRADVARRGQGQPRRGAVRPGADGGGLGSARPIPARSATCPASARSGPTPTAPSSWPSCASMPLGRTDEAGPAHRLRRRRGRRRRRLRRSRALRRARRPAEARWRRGGGPLGDRRRRAAVGAVALRR